jgi:hypothetical protein
MLFACPADKPWDYGSGKCINLGAFARATTAFDIATDVFLVGLPTYIFGTLQFQKAGKWTVVGVFSTRALIIIPSVFRMLSIRPAFETDSPDFTWNCVNFQIWTTIAMHLSIITASTPCIRPFLRSLESGLLDSSMKKHPRLQLDNGEQDKSFALTTISGWSASRLLDNRRRGSASNSQNTVRRSILCGGDRSRGSDQEEAMDEDHEFARQLRPDWSEHKTNIQSTRTFPQFSHIPSLDGSKGTGSTGSLNWGITITKETNILFEEDGRHVQEINTCTNIGQAR